jgi:hypothetical protein
MNKTAAWLLGIVTLGIILTFAFVGCERIDAGHVGLKVNMVGGDKGVSKTEYVTGWNFYNRMTSKIIEFPTFQQHVEYDPIVVPSKGGTTFTIHPSFNYSVNAGEVSEMYQQLRQPLAQLQQGYILNALRIALRETTNRFTVDSILNNVSIYDATITDTLNKRLHPWFTVSQFTSNLTPDENLKKTLGAKALAIQEALQLENEQRKIKVQAENDIIVAKRDSTIKVTGAAADAKSVSLIQEQLAKSPQYVELKKVEKWNGTVPQFLGSSGSNFLIDLGKK